MKRKKEREKVEVEGGGEKIQVGVRERRRRGSANSKGIVLYQFRTIKHYTNYIGYRRNYVENKYQYDKFYK